MHLSYLLPPALAALVTLLGLLAALRFFPKWGLMDSPVDYGLTRRPIPYSAGMIFFIVFLVTVVVFVDITKPIAGLLFAGLLITVVSFLDDRMRLSPWLRLGVQIFAGVILVLAGIKMQIISNPFGAPLYLDAIEFTLLGQEIWLLSAIILVGWLVLMMNVMNWMDGIPGLSSGISTIAQVSLFILSTQQFHVVDQSALITISSALAASSLVFLCFDFSPPKLLMGDTGSMFLGFMLGALSFLAGGKVATALLIMGFPMIDAVVVVVRRMLKGTSPLRGDYSHFHHRLLHVGLSPRKALVFNYVLCSACAVIALVLNSTSTKAIAFGSFAMVMFIIGLTLRGKNVDKSS